jgi:pyruvate dehydrogenase E2 component (dihydrolipoamide acetyltransferase)
MDIVMPQPGETVTEALITSWSKAVGDEVCAGDVLFEIDTDKTAMEVPAITDGILTEIRVQAGAEAKVGSVVGVLAGRSNGRASPSSPAPVPTAPADMHLVRTPPRNFGPSRLADGRRITPLARRLAAEAVLDLATIRGSGPRGRIVAADVRAPVMSQTPPSAPEGDAVRAAYADIAFEEIALDGMRRTIARRLIESKQTVPHFYLSRSVAVDRLLALRAEMNAGRELRISVNDLMVKAFALALGRVPQANGVWGGDAILRFAQVDVGVAIAVEGGLFTPVVRSANTRSVAAIAAQIRQFAAAARNRELQPDDWRGGVAAVSNLGMFGIDQFQAIVNPPQSSILAVGAARREAVETPDGGVRFEQRMTVTLSADHRVIDGALGAQVLSAFAEIVETPLAILL